MKTIARIGGTDIHYKVFGNGPPVLLIMGLGTRGDSWTPVSEALAGAGFTAIQFDNRDVGWSSLFEGSSYEVTDMAADALGLLDYLGISEAHLVGMSMGGMIAQEILVSRPGRVRRAVLMATAPGGQNSVLPSPDLLAPLRRPSDDPAVMLRSLYTTITAPGFASANAALIDMTVGAALRRPTSPEAVTRQLAAILRWTSWDRLDTVTAPTLVIHGDADPLLPHANGVAIAGRIRGARLLTLAGVGHLVPLEAPGDTFRAIECFLREGDAPGS